MYVFWHGHFLLIRDCCLCWSRDEFESLLGGPREWTDSLETNDGTDCVDFETLNKIIWPSIVSVQENAGDAAGVRDDHI